MDNIISKAVVKWGGVSAAIVSLVVLAVQYPISTTWPIGGDAASYISKALRLIDSLGSPVETLPILTSSRYPLSVAILAGSRILPLSWPDLYVWMMASAHILTGLSLGWLLYRLAGWRSATIGMFIWSLTTTGYNLHFEDGTFAQLLSLAFLLLFFERVAAGSWRGAGLAWVAVMGSHPLSGFFLILVTVICLPVWWFRHRRLDKKYQSTLKVLTLLATLSLMAILMNYRLRSSTILAGENSQGMDLIDMLRSTFGFWMILAVLGWWMMQRAIKSVFVLVFINTFVILAVFLALNDYFGIGMWVVRFRSYFILAVIIGAAIAWPRLLRLAMTSRIHRVVFTVLLLLSMSTNAWQGSAQIYNIYESDALYKRLSSREREAIEWAALQLPPQSVIVSSEENRHSEWISILTPHDYYGLPSDHEFWSANDQEIQAIISKDGYTHMIFFMNREEIFGSIADNPDSYIQVFNNNDAVIYSL